MFLCVQLFEGNWKPPAATFKCLRTFQFIRKKPLQANAQKGPELTFFGSRSSQAVFLNQFGKKFLHQVLRIVSTPSARSYERVNGMPSKCDKVLPMPRISWARFVLCREHRRPPCRCKERLVFVDDGHTFDIVQIITLLEPFVTKNFVGFAQSLDGLSRALYCRCRNLLPASNQH